MKKNSKGLFEWTDDVKAELRELRERGLTYNQIAKIWNISSNAISGMGNRMGLPLVMLRIHKQNAERPFHPAKLKDNLQGAAAVEVAKLRVEKGAVNPPARQPAPQFVCEEPPLIPYDGIEMPPLDGCCSVERVGKGWMQCGRPVVSRRNPFCAEHAARFYMEKPVGRSRADSPGAS